MVGLFLRLKLRLLRGALRSPARLAFTLIGLLLGLATAAVVLAGLLVLRDDPPVLTAAGILIAVAFALGWTTLPVAAFGVDETLDVSRLALLPIPRRQLLAGLLASALIGVPALLTVLLLGVTVFLTATSPAAVPVALVAWVLLVATCLLLGRLVTSALSRLLRSRRGRDLAVVVGLAVVLAAQLPRLLVENLGEDGLVRIGDVLRWTPPGALVHAVAARSVLDLLYGAGFVLLLLAGWYVALGAALTVVDASTTPPRRGRRRGPLALLPDGRLGAVAGKDLRYAWREPRLKFSWLQMMVFGVAVPAFTLLSAGRYAPLAAAMLTALLATSLSFNQFGPEGSAFWLTAASTASERDARTDLAGRNLATAAITLTWVLASATVLAFVTVPAGEVPVAVLVSFGAAAAVVGGGCGVAVVASVLAPYPMPEQAGAAFAGPGPGRGCIAGLVWIVGTGVVALAALPVAVPALIWGDRLWVALLVLVGGSAWGAGLAWLGRRIAAATMLDRLPELLVTLTPERS